VRGQARRRADGSWLDVITAELARQPAELSAREAVVGAFHAIGGGFVGISEQVRDLAVMTRSSPVLNAWILQIYVGYEAAIAELVTSRPAARRSAPAAHRGIGDGVRADRPRRLAGARWFAAGAGARGTDDILHRVTFGRRQ
jgi:hypothetical protein